MKSLACKYCDIFKNTQYNFIKKRLRHRCFPVNFSKFLRARFFAEHLRWLLLIFLEWSNLKLSKTVFILTADLLVSKKYETFILVNTFCLMKTTKDLVHGKIFNRQNITQPKPSTKIYFKCATITNRNKREYIHHVSKTDFKSF